MLPRTLVDEESVAFLWHVTYTDVVDIFRQAITFESSIENINQKCQ